MNNSKTPMYTNKGGAWVPVPDDNALHDHLVEQAEEGEMDYIDQVIEAMGDASVGFESYTLGHDDAGMVSDYIIELRERVARQEEQIEELPLLRAIAASASGFIHWFGAEGSFCDDAIVEYEILRERVRLYNENKKQA